LTTPGDGALYFIRDELRSEFLAEAKDCKNPVREISKNIFFSESGERQYWVLDYWLVDKIKFASVAHAAKELRRVAKRWMYVGGANFRRGQLIADALKIKKRGLLEFPVAVAAVDAGTHAFTLFDKETLFMTSNPLKHSYAGGGVRFHENRTGPPSRAYLKLYEALTLVGRHPGAKDVVLDLGATPGGWSYVTAELGARVLMVDRAKPHENLFRKFARLEFKMGDGLNPPEEWLNAATYILSDMACEPTKLFASVEAWLRLPHVQVIVCTLKFHGVSDKRLIHRFAALAGSEIYHLWHNGHELTWVWQR